MPVPPLCPWDRHTRDSVIVSHGCGRLGGPAASPDGLGAANSAVTSVLTVKGLGVSHAYTELPGVCPPKRLVSVPAAEEGVRSF